MFSHSINRYGWKTTSTSSLVDVQLRKMILKKISLNWWTTRFLVSLSYVYLFFYVNLFIAGKVVLFMIICSYVFIDSLIESKIFSLCFFVLVHSLIFFMFLCSCVFIDFLYVSLFICMDSFIVDKVYIFMFICSYVLIHSLQVKFLSLWLFVLMYWFIHCR